MVKDDQLQLALGLFDGLRHNRESLANGLHILVTQLWIFAGCILPNTYVPREIHLARLVYGKKTGDNT